MVFKVHSLFVKGKLKAMYETFEKLLKLHNITPYKVSKDTGIPYSALSDWKKGRSTPKKEKLEKLADYFSVSVDFLLGREKQMEFGLRFTSDEEAKIYIEIMNSLEKLNTDGVNEALRYIKYLTTSDNYIK